MTISTASEIGPYEPDHIAPDEPRFVLVGRDPDAPSAVLAWSDHRRSRITKELAAFGPHDKVPEGLREDLRKCTDADLVAHDMRRWRMSIPEHDTEARQKPSYNGIVKTAGEMDEAARKALVANQVRNLRESAFYASEARDHLGRLGVLEPGQLVSIDEALVLLNTVADAHAPVRPGFEPVLPMGATGGVPAQ